jgi:hypothetical protein
VRSDHGWAGPSDESLLLQGTKVLHPPWSWTGVHVDGPSPKIIEGGPGRWDRVAALATICLASLALAALPLTATATAPTSAIAVTALATTAALSLTLAATARGTGLSRGSGSLGVVGVECLRGNHRCVGAEHDHLQDQFILDLEKNWEHCA